jgi:hypothetical protein
MLYSVRDSLNHWQQTVSLTSAFSMRRCVRAGSKRVVLPTGQIKIIKYESLLINHISLSSGLAFAMPLGGTILKGAHFRNSPSHDTWTALYAVLAIYEPILLGIETFYERLRLGKSVMAAALCRR